ncbi:hypothetical protein [Myroides odoratus]|uniref:Uncharacterized protein n=1 Tax=Myroides odoratus TaxID=256 RepID=A0A378U2V7_MYROD|nr:hypothetical protein [Myroides odoratus]MCS4237295.1 hypothetical protein [Myroides odoratus]MDH6601975.1 hypothetical protein [Myroides gitamensis]QQU03148.1 hypothetical protein I6I89_15250 [Myroides odoratus]STZ69605.1 Uncharacterised protein [Myroides odoratus]
MKNVNINGSKYAFLVVVFFIPLISNLLHYVIIEHEFGQRNHEVEWIDGSKVHYCDQYLFKIHPAIEVPQLSIDIVPLVLYETTVLLICKLIEQRVSCFYFNRGPPFV